MRLVDQRAEMMRRVERIAGFPVTRACHNVLQQLILDRFVDDQARAGRTVFTHVPESAIDDVSGHQVQVLGILEHDRRVLAAALEHDLLQVRFGRIMQESDARFRSNR